MSELEDAVRTLHSPDLNEREAALDRVEALAKRGFSSEEVAFLIEAATHAFPPSKFNFRQYAEGLLRATWGHLADAHVPILVSSYPRLSTSTKAGALASLARLGSERATDAYVQLLMAEGWPERAYPPAVSPYEEQPRFPEKVLPPFADGAIRGLPSDVGWHLVLAYATRGEIPSALRPQIQAAALKSADAAMTHARSFQQATGIAWRWDDGYADARQTAGILLDVLGYLGPSASTFALLEQGESVRDPRLALFAIASTVRLGREPGRPSLEAVAADSETRGLLLSRLAAAGRRDLFPPTQLTQEKLAESDMVRWLTFPTELGRAPDEIELMKTARFETDGGAGSYYLFRFRTHPPHWSAKDGWMAGISGPFFDAEGPSPDGGGDTFSRFTKWDELTADEHLASVIEVLDEWREHPDGE